MAVAEAVMSLRKNLLLVTSTFSNHKIILELVLQDLKKLTNIFYEQKLRDELCEEDCFMIMKTLEVFCQLQNDEEVLELTTELFRCMRNACVNNRPNQNWIAKSPSCTNVFFSFFVKLITTTELNLDNPCILIKRIECLRCGLQFIGNLIVGNELNKIIVWEKLSCYFSWLLNQNIDDKILRYTCMVIYNCLTQIPRNKKDFLENSSKEIFPLILNITMTKEVEWGLYIIELMLEEDEFISTVYNQITDEQRFYLLDVIQNYLHSHSTSESSNNLSVLSINNLDFLKEVFIKKVDLVLKMCEHFKCSSNDPVAVMKLLGILCCASACVKYHKHIQSDANLIIIATFFLKGIHVAGKNGCEYFTPVEKLSMATHPESEKLKDNPVHGIKRDLIRLIGNLCWECKDNQDRFREMEGIPVLLDCCRIDAQNPFIIQWVIFAIHNLCDNNPENQALIANMENLGYTESSMEKLREAVLNNGRSENTTEENYNFCCEEFNTSVSLQEKPKREDDKYSDVNDLFF